MQHRPVLILGKGISGLGACEALKKRGVAAVTCDETEVDKRMTEEYSMVVVSPSVPITHRIYDWARIRNIEVIGEIELGSRLTQKPVAAVTGTNGKTTVTTLMAMMLAGQNAVATGNIGRSFALDACSDYGAFVVECSSFQLESINSFAPRVAVITNLTEDHLDRHKSMSSYAKAKLKIAVYQTQSDYLVLSADDLECGAMEGFSPKSKVVYFSAKQPVFGAYLKNKRLYLFDEQLCHINDVALIGVHNAKNALAAALAASLMGADKAAIRAALSSYKGGTHRLSYVTSVRGVAFYNDSKGTNVASTVAAISAMPSTTCLIAGGSDKGYEYDGIFSGAPKTLVKVCAVGETADKIIAAAERSGFKSVKKCSSVCAATIEAYKSGADCVLLSPASASFDSYTSYIKRGEDYEKAVWEIKSIESKR